MVRRATAVISACLFTAGAIPPAPALASAVLGMSELPECAPVAARAVAPRRGLTLPVPLPAVAEMLTGPAPRLAGLRGSRLPITVPTWVHVITDGRLGASDTAARNQIATLNAAYSGQFGGADTGIQFRLDGLTRTINALWFRDPVTHERAIKGLRKGGPETLNLYIAQLSGLVLGYSTYPLWYSREPTLDGVVIDWRSLPGGSLRSFDRGFTGVHEIGHWLGLRHTFENGCAEPGDGIADTSPEAYATNGCVTGKDTCEGGGADPIHNFMDYSDDACMSEFTAGQALKMRETWTAHRSPRTDITLSR
jgi:hypothetical protein